jgi:hypothetical protein
VKDPWDVKQDKCPAPQIVGWWANFFSSIWALQLSFRLVLINSSQVGLPDSFGLETGLWEMVSTFMCEERGHGWVNHALRNQNAVIGWDNSRLSRARALIVAAVDRPSE